MDLWLALELYFCLLTTKFLFSGLVMADNYDVNALEDDEHSDPNILCCNYTT